MSAHVPHLQAITVAKCVLLCSSAAACDYNPVGASGNGGFGACTSGPYAVSSIAFVPADTLRVRVGQQDSVEVRARDAMGASGQLCGPRVTTTMAATHIATVSGTGGGVVRVTVRGIMAGHTVLRAGAGGRHDSLTIIVSP